MGGQEQAGEASDRGAFSADTENHLTGLEHRKCKGGDWVSGQLGWQVHRTEHGEVTWMGRVCGRLRQESWVRQWGSLQWE